MTPDPEAEAVVRRLTKAQREELSRLGSVWSLVGKTRLGSALVEYKEVGVGKRKGAVAAVLTPLGLRVRRALQEHNHDHNG